MKAILKILLFILTMVLLCQCEKENQSPKCNIITPLNNTSFYRGDTINITVEASDPDGTISEIHLYIDNIGITSLQSFPYKYAWNTEDLSLKTYEVKATAIDNEGGENSSIVSIIIESGLPNVTTSGITEISYNTAICGGNVTNPSSYPVTARGLVWDTLQSPTLDTNYEYILDSSGTGEYSCNITRLISNTTYYIKAYTTNKEGTVYGDEKSFKTLSYWKEKGIFTDTRDEQIYKWVKIGDQTWMAENLKSIQYVDGTPIVNYFWYGNDSATYGDIYGALYTWEATMNGVASSSNNPSGVRGVCPYGWHIPSDAEWKELEMFLGMNQDDAENEGWRGHEGKKLKEKGTTHWTLSSNPTSPSSLGTNESGFTALPGGLRLYDGSSFDFIKEVGYWWCSTEVSTTAALSRGLKYTSSEVSRNGLLKTYSYSVRCIKDQ